jgi:hypothetical protein
MRILSRASLRYYTKLFLSCARSFYYEGLYTLIDKAKRDIEGATHIFLARTTLQSFVCFRIEAYLFSSAVHVLPPTA